MSSPNIKNTSSTSTTTNHHTTNNVPIMSRLTPSSMNDPAFWEGDCNLFSLDLPQLPPPPPPSQQQQHPYATAQPLGPHQHQHEHFGNNDDDDGSPSSSGAGLLEQLLPPAPPPLPAQHHQDLYNKNPPLLAWSPQEQQFGKDAVDQPSLLDNQHPPTKLAKKKRKPVDMTTGANNNNNNNNNKKMMRKRKLDKNFEKVYKNLTDKDCLLGRGGESNAHPGNKDYLHFKDSLLDEFEKAGNNHKKKQAVAERLVAYVEETGGHFLVKEDDDNCTPDDSRNNNNKRYFIAPRGWVLEKAKQVLREARNKKMKKVKNDEDDGDDKRLDEYMHAYSLDLLLSEPMDEEYQLQQLWKEIGCENGSSNTEGAEIKLHQSSRPPTPTASSSHWI